MRGGGGFVAIHNAFGTEYNWPWYEGLLGNANYYSHGPFQNGTLNIVGSADSSTAGLPSTIPFKDEWYDFVPYPTNVKFLVTVDETTLAGKDSESSGPRQLPPGCMVPVLRRRPRVADDSGPRHACPTRTVRASPGQAEFKQAHRAGHQVGDGPDAFLPVVQLQG